MDTAPSLSCCGCFDHPTCEAPSSGQSAAVWTCIELLVVVALCWKQGLSPLDVPATYCRRLRLGLTGRTWADEIGAQVVGSDAPPPVATKNASARLLAVFCTGSAALLIIGLRSGFLCRPPSVGELTSLQALLSLPVPLIFPGLVEECFWRFMVLPAADEAPAGWSSQHLLALAGFLAYHLDALHFAPRYIFVDPRFLAMAAVLGVACTDAAIATRTVWAGAFMHGLWVWAWLNCMGKCEG
uniref:CAAX prenyl protease 2/Lysostaphin resistance protein A-like domain-containing protein n=1 Tax=Emiliania huxleyi TaxID=2903 RepID=A0A7S3U530_EMIHU|mmetsp:Transcript_36985/g.111357  ORF Transcript_36985/g.111357 Transcript_36985/m.111357 type:complete len:241 (+) Transcript_36985:84-806(+)